MTNVTKSLVVLATNKSLNMSKTSPIPTVRFPGSAERARASASVHEHPDSLWSHLCQLSVDPVGEGLLLNLFLFHC